MQYKQIPTTFCPRFNHTANALVKATANETIKIGPKKKNKKKKPAENGIALILSTGVGNNNQIARPIFFAFARSRTWSVITLLAAFIDHHHNYRQATEYNILTSTLSHRRRVQRPTFDVVIMYSRILWRFLGANHAVSYIIFLFAI